MAKSSADDQELRRACEAALDGGGSKQKVVLSIRVAKSRGVWGKAGRLGRQMAKPRVLALTTKISSIGQRAKALLRVLKYSSGGVLEPVKLYKLKHLSKMEVVANDPSGCTFMLGFDNLRSQSVAPPQWTMRNIDDRNRLLVSILNMSKEILGRLPKVVGIDIVEMALWAKDNTTIAHIQAISQEEHTQSVVIENDTKVTVERDLVSQDEEEDMKALLDTTFGLGGRLVRIMRKIDCTIMKTMYALTYSIGSDHHHHLFYHYFEMASSWSSISQNLHKVMLVSSSFEFIL